MLFTASLLAALAAGDSLPRTPLDTARVEQGPAVIVHRQPSVPVVALRLAVLADDPPGYAGVGHLVQHLVQPRLEAEVARVGGRVRMERTSDAVVFTVLGPADELEHLAQALQGALRPPDALYGELLQAGRALAEERLVEWETASNHTRAALRARLFPEDLPAAGTESAAQRLVEPSALRAAWSLLYQPERVSVVAVGDVRLDEVRAAFEKLPAPLAVRTREALQDTAVVAPLAPAEATRGWFGLGYLATGLDPAGVTVAARLLRDRVQARLPAASVEVEHWWTHHGQAVALVVGAPPEALDAARRAVGTAVAAAEQGLAESQVREAARAVRRELLFYTRTPDRMAEVIGQFSDRDGDPDAAQRFHTALQQVDEEQVRSVLQSLSRQTPVRVEIPPQKLNRR